MNLPQQVKTFLDDVLLKAVGDLGDGMVLLEGFKIVYSNEAFCRISGLSEAELGSLPSFFELVPPDQREAIQRNIQRHSVGSKSSGRYETQIAGKNSKLRQLELTVNLLQLDPGTYQVLLVRDITELKALREDLDRQGLQYKQLFENHPSPILLYDVETLDILSVNASAVDTYGYTREEFTRQALPALHDPADVPSLLQKIRDLREEPCILKGTIRHRKKDGSFMEVEIHSHPIQFEGRKARMAMILDMTEHRRAESILHHSEEKFRILFNNVVDSILIFEVDPEGSPGRFLEVNSNSCTKLGYTREEFTRMTFLDLVVPEEADNLPKAFKRLNTSAHMTIERLCRTKTGLRVPMEINAHLFDWEGRQVVQAIARDVTERKRAEETIRRQAYYDVLTNLPNRTLFKDRLEQAMKQAGRNKQAMGVFILDLDRFKNINETLGHILGDKLLVAVAERLLSILNESETIARFGGDEFTLLLPQVSSIEEAVQHAQKIVQLLSAPFKLNGHELHVTTSIGMAFYPEDGETSETLLKNAETAMYRAKEQGRNNYQLYASVMNVSAFKQLLMENSLRRALEKEEFVVYYQPQIDLKTHQVVGAEALVRWNHPDLGLVFPSEFIGLAEETGLIVPLGEWILRSVCKQSRKLHEGGVPFTVSVNLSARQFQQHNLVTLISGILEETGFDAKFLGLEITESIAMKDADYTVNALSEFKKMGIHMSLDDFGTGYSSLSYLKRFPLQTLKIDRSFVRDITSDPNDAAIVNAVIALAHSLKLEVVAEGVETEGQLNFLKTHHCDQVQGYYFSHPLSEENFAKFLKEGRR